MIDVPSLKAKVERKLTGIITLNAPNSIGRVLMVYFTDAFTRPTNAFPTIHANYWEAYTIAQLFLAQGYTVDVIDAKKDIALTRKYDIIFDTLNGIERYDHLLHPWGKRIFYFLTTEATVNNKAEADRLDAIQKSKGVRLLSRRSIPLSKSFALADFVCGLGNATTQQSYLESIEAGHTKKIYSIPGSTTVTFAPFKRDWEVAKKHFLFLSGGGMAHKGLDILLSLFSKQTDYELHICAPVAAEEDFYTLYKKELCETPNIHLHGRVDVGSPAFIDIARSCGFLIYPSCAEGQSGAVLNALQAGLIPIISTMSGVDVIEHGGFTFSEMKEDAIHRAMVHALQLDTAALQERSERIYHYGRSTYNRSTFTAAFAHFIEHTITEKPTISVIIPTHNDEKTIAVAIESMLRQTLPPHEIIVVDDHSTDSTRTVVEQLAARDARIRYAALPWNDPKRFNRFGRNINAGYQARNFGFTLLSPQSDWVTFQDADDASLPNRLEVQYALAQAFHAAHICLDWQQYQDALLTTTFDIDAYTKENGGSLSTLPHIGPTAIYALSQKTKGVVANISKWLHEHLPFEWKQKRFINKLFMPDLSAYPGTGNSPLFRRSILEKVQFRPLQSRIWPSFVGRGADRDFNFQVAETYKRSYVVPLPLYLWRVPNQNPKTVNYNKYLISARLDDARK